MKCAPPPGAVAPFDCAHCVRVQRPCVRLASSAPARRRRPASAVPRPATPPPASASVRRRPPPPAAPVVSTSLLAFLKVPEALASFTFDLNPHKAVLYWRDRRISLQLERKRIDAYLAFVDKEYAWAVSRGIAASSLGGRPAKRARVDKGKGKACDEGPEADDGAGDGAGPSV